MICPALTEIGRKIFKNEFEMVYSLDIHIQTFTCTQSLKNLNITKFVMLLTRIAANKHVIGILPLQKPVEKVV